MRRPFYGQGTPPPIARMDMRAATEPGRAFRDMFLNLGKVAGDALKSYGEKKKAEEDRKALTEQTKNFLINAPEVARQLGVSGNENVSFEEAVGKAADAWSKDPKSFETLKGLVSFQEQLKNNQLQQTATQMNIASSAATMGRNTETDARNEAARTGQNQLSNLFARGLANETDPAAFMEKIQMAREDGILNQEGVNLANNHFFKLQKREDDAIQAKNEQDFEMRKMQAEAIAKGPQLTDGEKALDREFAKEMVSFNLPDINKGLAQLTEASKELGESDTLTGPWVSLLPNFVGDRVNPQAAEVREAVEEVVQRNLRLVLGAQFTEKEGERLISRAFNPKLQESENKKRVERLITSIRDAAQEKLNMRSHFQKFGTLRGYNFDGPSYKTIEKRAFGDVQKSEGDNREALLEEEKRLKEILMEREGIFNSPPVPVINTPGAR